MIYLSSVAKVFSTAGRPPNIVFLPTSIALPSQRRIAVVGHSLAGKTVLLRMLTGLEAPDEGRVLTPLRLSPIANSSAFLDLRMTVRDNIRYVARLYGVDAETLALAVASYARMGFPLESAVTSLSRNARKLFDIALVAVLPFDCYLIDHIMHIDSGVIDRYIDGALRRNAGVIFATNRIHDVRQYADFVVVVRDKTLYPFDSVNEAIRFYDRQAA